MSLTRDTRPGAYAFWDYGREFAFNCPCGCGDVVSLPIVSKKVAPNDGTWEWDGNRESPTLSPSIRRLMGCKFHGWIRNGVWSSAGDGAPVAPNCYKAGDPNPFVPETPMAAPSADISPNTPDPAPQTVTENPLLKHPKAQKAPDGWGASSVFHFFDGILHQLHSKLEVGSNEHVWVPIGGQKDSLGDDGKTGSSPVLTPAERAQINMETPDKGPQPNRIFPPDFDPQAAKPSLKPGVNAPGQYTSADAGASLGGVETSTPPRAPDPNAPVQAAAEAQGQTPQQREGAPRFDPHTGQPLT